MMLRQAAFAGAALSAPWLALTLASERLIRPRVFYSGPWHPDPPDVLGVPYEEARIPTADGPELQGWYFPARPATLGHPLATILFMHGTSYNASDMWVTAERTQAFRDFLRGIGCDFFIFDYRGYGQNAGTPSEEGTYIDAQAALAWLRARPDVDPTRIIYYGFSLGTGIAAELALREPPAGLVLRAPFTSIRDIIAGRHPLLRAVLAAAPWLPLTRYDTLSKIARLRSPLLVMHGDADRTVPEWMGQRVFQAAPEPKTYVSFPDTGHSDVATDLVVPAIRRFVEGLEGIRSQDSELSA